MAKHKKKVIVNQEASDLKKRHGRFPTARATEFHQDKSRYNRKVKHKKEEVLCLPEEATESMRN